MTEFVHGLTPEIAANSIYDYIENTLGMQIITSKRRITVEHATAQDEKVLAMDSYDCVAVVTNQTFNASGMLFEFTQSRHQRIISAFRTLPPEKNEHRAFRLDSPTHVSPYLCQPARRRILTSARQYRLPLKQVTPSAEHDFNDLHPAIQKRRESIRNQLS